MGRHREETIRSYDKHGEVYRMSLAWRPMVKLCTWECSCGAHGRIWWAYAHEAVKGWEQHVSADHPDAEL